MGSRGGPPPARRGEEERVMGREAVQRRELAGGAGGERSLAGQEARALDQHGFGRLLVDLAACSLDLLVARSLR